MFVCMCTRFFVFTPTILIALSRCPPSTKTKKKSPEHNLGAKKNIEYYYLRVPQSPNTLTKQKHAVCAACVSNLAY